MNQSNKKTLLSLDDCNVLKGIAIIGIFLHNFCHLLDGVVRENEYIFDISRPFSLYREIKSFGIDIHLHLISFFGHYGVPIFLFLSAYGLEMKYNNSAVGENPNNVKDIWRFSRYHFLKLFKLLSVGYITFLVFHYLMKDAAPIAPKGTKIILLQLGMIINMFQKYNWVIDPGPYWFFGLMLQLYVFYRLLLYKRHWGYTVFSMLIFTFLQLSFIPSSKAMEYYRYNFMGSVLPFCLGILYARYGHLITSFDNNRKNIISGLVISLLSAILILLFSFNFNTWILVPLFVCVFSVYFIKILKHKYLKSFYQILLWVGSLSSALFISHPIARKIFLNVSRYDNLYTGLICYILVSFALAWVFSQILKKIPNPKY